MARCDFSGVETITGDLRVIKIVAVTGPVGTPESFSVGVTCGDGTVETVTLPGDGGAGMPVVEVPAGAECAVMEMEVPDGASAPPELPKTGGNALDTASGAWNVLFVLAGIRGIGGIAYALHRRAT